MNTFESASSHPQDSQHAKKQSSQTDLTPLAASVAEVRPVAKVAPVVKTDAEWREELTPAEYQVLRQAGTERPFTGEYWDSMDEGVYECRACGAELFSSREKFSSHCGWPSFFAPLAEGRVRYLHDNSLGMKRVEVRCGSCDSHLGHLFEGEGYDTPTDERFCINSICLKLRPAS